MRGALFGPGCTGEPWVVVCCFEEAAVLQAFCLWLGIWLLTYEVR